MCFASVSASSCHQPALHSSSHPVNETLPHPSWDSFGYNISVEIFQCCLFYCIVHEIKHWRKFMCYAFSFSNTSGIGSVISNGDWTPLGTLVVPLSTTTHSALLRCRESVEIILHILSVPHPVTPHFLSAPKDPPSMEFILSHTTYVYIGPFPTL